MALNDDEYVDQLSKQIDQNILEKMKVSNFASAVGSSAPMTTPALKKVELSGLVHDDLKEGMHVRLKCGCEGFVKGISSLDDPDNRWFSVLNTKAGCRTIQGLISLELVYAETPGKLRIDTYHADTFSRILPAFECPAPSWFKSMKDVPRSANERRAVRVRLDEGVDFLIPGALRTRASTRWQRY